MSMTSTIENGFGSRLMTNGILLNNELTDFSFRDQRDGKPIANRAEPGKRPRSSKTTTPFWSSVLPVAAGSSAMSPKPLSPISTWGMDIQQAISSPHPVNRFGKFDVEAGTTAEDLIPALTAWGYEVGARGLTSGLHGIVFTADGLQGGADPRREGIILGD